MGADPLFQSTRNSPCFEQVKDIFSHSLSLLLDLPVGDSPLHFSVFPAFQGASYLQRYDLPCQRLMTTAQLPSEVRWYPEY